jgi:hypothetical protein
MSGFGVTPSVRVRDMAEALPFYLGPLEFTLERGGDQDEGNWLSFWSVIRADGS